MNHSPSQSRDKRTVETYIEEYDLMSNLKKLGISDNVILYAKEEIPISLRDNQYYYEMMRYDQEVLVDPKKIVSMRRLDRDKSIFENAKYGSGLDLNRMSDGLYYIENSSLESLYDWYKSQCKPVSLLHYWDDDMFAIDKDGTHRCLYAKLIGAPCIRAEVTVLKRNNESYYAYMYLKQNSECFNISYINPKSEISTNYISFCYKNKDYSIRGYTDPFINGTYSKESVIKLIEELRSDWSYLSSKDISKLIRKRDLEIYQHRRLQHHLEKRRKINRENLMELISNIKIRK